MCAYFPRQVRSVHEALGGRGGRYVYISSVSAYSPQVQPNYDESAPLATASAADLDATEITNENYGALEAACEHVSTELFGPGTTIIRPTYVIGPHDHSYRFTWWVDRIARGGTILAPGRPDDPIQVIDGRDQASFLVGLLEQSVTGTFHTVSPAPPFGFGQMLETIASVVAPAGTTFSWVPSDFLLGEGVDGMALPLWAEGDGEAAAMSTANPAAAYAAGLSPRPLAATVADIQAEDRSSGGHAGVGLTAEREADLLARWAARG